MQRIVDNGAEKITENEFFDDQTRLATGPSAKANTEVSTFKREFLEFLAGYKNLDYYQLLGVLGADLTNPVDYEWKVKDAGQHLEDALKNFTTDFRTYRIEGTLNTPKYTSGVGIFRNDEDFKALLKEVFDAKNLLPHENARNLYDADLGNVIVAKIVAHQHKLSDLQTLGIPEEQLPTKKEDAIIYVERVAALRTKQVELGYQSLEKFGKLTKEVLDQKSQDFALAKDVILKSKTALIEDINEAAKAQYSYKEFTDLLDIRGPMWEQVATLIGVKLEDLKLINKATKLALISLAKRRPGPIGVFIALELIAPSIYEKLPQDLKEKIHTNISAKRVQIEEILKETVFAPGREFVDTIRDAGKRTAEEVKLTADALATEAKTVGEEALVTARKVQVLAEAGTKNFVAKLLKKLGKK